MILRGQIDWTDWVGRIERKRTSLAHRREASARGLPGDFFTAVTYASFKLDEIEVTEAQIAAAAERGRTGRAIRSRLAQRIRNHIAILRHIESSLRNGATLVSETVIRWYTSISCGLSNSPLDDATAQRLDSLVARVNSPQLRLPAAMTEIAQLHNQLIVDPFVPSFNGILARLLLQFHLGRCGLPPVMFDPFADRKLPRDEHRLLKRLLERVEGSFEKLEASSPI
jgi:hypothetical protein